MIQVTDQFGARDVQRVVVSVQAFPAFTSCGVDGHRGPALYLPGAGQRPRW
ncbi:hypothetical protein [Comamonas sp. JC664]|uniref:hypothetical protein n=1 Tax=Comamonas sp. JC664 TaxID=2801917 RepID=UPI003620FB8E